MAIDERLAELTEANAKLEAEIVRLNQEIEELQIDYSNKIAKAKVEYETKEIDLKKQIKDLTLALELRNSNERGRERTKDGKKKNVNQIWEEITGDTL